MNKKAKITILALIIFSAIMLVILWFLFSVFSGLYTEFAVNSQNAKTYVSFSRLLKEGWEKGSVKYDIRLGVINEQDSFAIGIITSNSADAILQKRTCFGEIKTDCVKSSTKSIVRTCLTQPCICLFRLKYRFGDFHACSPPEPNQIYTVTPTGDTAAFAITAIENWNNNYFLGADGLLGKLDRLDALVCETIISGLNCESAGNPCIIKYQGGIFVWMHSPTYFTSATLDRHFIGSVGDYYAIMETYPLVVPRISAAPFEDC